MKILVISDSHGQISNLEHILGFAKKIGAGALIHCGDWDNLSSVEKVLESQIPLYSVSGNADVDPSIKKRLEEGSEKYGENFLYFELEGKKIGVTHKPKDVKKYFENSGADIVFCGHLHSVDDNFVSGIRVVRPGAVKSGINIVVYETKNGDLEFIKDE